MRCILVVYTVKPLFSGHMTRLWPFFRYSRFRRVMQHLCNCNIRSETDDHNVCIPNPTREHEPLVTSRPMRDELMQRCVEATAQGLSPTAAGLCLHGNKLLHAFQGQTATQGLASYSATCLSPRRIQAQKCATNLTDLQIVAAQSNCENRCRWWRAKTSNDSTVATAYLAMPDVPEDNEEPVKPVCWRSFTPRK